MTSTLPGLENATAIITGGGSGIGQACACTLAESGARIVVADVIASRAHAVVRDLRGRGSEAIAVVGDLSEQQWVDWTVTAALDEYGSIDILINNAGIMDGMTAPDEVTDEEWERVIRVNLTAPFKMMRAAVPHMLSQGRGSIVNTASEASLRGSAAGTPYTVSKHGIVGLTLSAAVMYRERGVRVNAVAPGATATNLRVEPSEHTEGPRAIAQYMGNVGRLAEPAEVAALIAFLASDAASDISGAVIPVDSAWSAI